MTQDLINQASISAPVSEKYPTYVAHLLVVDDIRNEPTNEFSDNYLANAEKFANDLLASVAIEDLPEVKIWREAFRSFGVKPSDSRSSFEALLRRTSKGLPRIDFLTDVYNALSVMHLLPIGGENFDKYQGAPRLEIAIGDETFDTTENGEAVIVNPMPGEVIWRDDLGVTCRRWNWRQCVRTRLSPDTKRALFIFDGLGEDSIVKTGKCAAELTELIVNLWPGAEVRSRSISA
ncbi:MAG: hypothetical protein RIT32_1006 [Actinomycetota bacterium]